MRIDRENDWFMDCYNPTESELKKWMEDPDAYEPTQDWDLCVGSFINLKSLVRLAHGKGPQQEFILHFLYVATADAFNHQRENIREGIDLVPHNTNKYLLEWRNKAEHLIANPTTYREKEWFDHIYSTRR